VFQRDYPAAHDTEHHKEITLFIYKTALAKWPVSIADQKIENCRAQRNTAFDRRMTDTGRASHN
jgi:hypothetical protein